MSSPGSSERLTIGEAVRLLQATYPDVTRSALRFLEREGLLDPVRTPGGHRLYRHSDLERVRTIKSWQAQRLSLAEVRQRLAELDALATPSALADRFLELAIAGDTATATREILLANEFGMSIGDLFDAILTPVLHEVGRLWAAGSVKVGQEHEITEAVRDVIAELTLRHARPDARMPVAVAACVAGERHDLGLRMVSGLLRQRGLRVHFLGANVAPGFLAEIVRLRQPDLVLLSACLATHEPAVRSTVTAVREAAGDDGHRLHIIIGGQGCTQPEGEPADSGVTVLTGDGLEVLVEQIMSLRSPSR